MNRAIVIPLVLLGLVLLVAFARYETIAPCGMLRSELKRQALSSAPEIDAESGFGMLGFAIGAIALDRVIEARTAAMGPLDCIGALARLHSRGLPDSFSTELQAAAPAPRSSPATSNEPVPQPTWQFRSTTDPITDNVFNRAAVVTDDAQLWVYLVDNAFRVGLRPDESISYSANAIEFRVDSNPAFSARIYANDNGDAHVTLTAAQVDQMIGGNELLVRYEGLGGATLLRFPLTNLRDALAPVGRPKPPPPPPKPPDFSRLPPDERVELWERQYEISGTSSTGKNAAAVWQSCIRIERIGPPPNTEAQRARVLDCVTTRGFPLR